METTNTNVAHVARYRVEVTLPPAMPELTGSTVPSAGFVATGVRGLGVRTDVRIDDARPGPRSWSPPV